MTSVSNIMAQNYDALVLLMHCGIRNCKILCEMCVLRLMLISNLDLNLYHSVDDQAENDPSVRFADEDRT